MKTFQQRHAFNVSQLRVLAKRIEKTIADGTHFALILFDQALAGEKVVDVAGHERTSAAGYSTYISNAERASIVAVLRECADNLERNLDRPGAIVPAAKMN